MRRILKAATAALLALCALPAAAHATIIFQPNYHATDPIAAGWQALEQADTGRLVLQGNQLRAELRPGDIYCSGTYCAHRSEVRGLRMTGGTDPHNWPLAEGSVRWLHEQLYVPADFTTSSNSADWLVATQIKGLYGGSPPVALEVYKGNWRLSACGTYYTLGPVTKNAAPVFDLGMQLSPDPAVGWIEAWFNHVQVVSNRPCATMDDFWDSSDNRTRTDPVYLKNGIYRSYTWDSLGVTHVLYFNAPLVTDTRPF